MKYFGQIHHQHGGVSAASTLISRVHFRTGVSFRKQFPGADLPQQVPVPPQVVVLDDDLSGKDHAYGMDHIPCIMDVGSFS